MEKFKLLCFTCLTVALLGLLQSDPAAAFDGDGGFDGGFDGGAFDDAGFDDGGFNGEDSGPDEVADANGTADDDSEQDDNQGDDDKDGHNDAPGHRGHGHYHGRGHHGRGHHTHIIYGWPAFGYGPAFGFGTFGYMPPAYYAYPRGSYRLAQPPVVHTEKKDASPPSPPQTYWYYCRDPEGYYPEVEECPDGWEQVSRQTQQED